MTDFLGEYEVTVDTKGRFLLPSGLRKQLPEGAADKFVMNRGFESCLSLYPMTVWNAIAGKISKMNDFKPNVREFKRLFLNGANIVEVDTAGRILITKSLLDYAGIQKDAVLSAQGNKVEIWERDAYYKYIKERGWNFSKLAEEVAGEVGNPFDID
jgi:MraZ protein